MNVDELKKGGFEDLGEGIFLKESLVGVTVYYRCNACKLIDENKRNFLKRPTSIEGKCPYCKTDYRRLIPVKKEAKK